MTLLVCSHEAAHAVVDWYLGFKVAQIQVLSAARFRAEKWLTNRKGEVLIGAAGYTELARKAFLGKDVTARNGERRLRPYAKTRLAAISAGPIMTAIDMNQSLAFAFAHGGGDDARMINTVREYAQIDQRTFGKIVESTALFLLSQNGYRAKMEVAGRLFSSGKVSGAQLDAICRTAFLGARRMNLCEGVGLKGYIDSKKPLIPQLTRRSLTCP